MTENKIKDIALKFFQGNATREEEELLHHWYEEKDLHCEDLLFIPIDKKIDVKERLFASIQVQLESEMQYKGINEISKKSWIRSIAASLLLLLSIGGAYFHLSEVKEPIHYTQLLKGDVGPGSNNAILELADGRVFNLDTVKIGKVISDHGMNIGKLEDGLLSIEISSLSTSASIKKNRIKTPKGGQYQIKLPDGTKVWLNASSTLVFSSVFMKDYREVELEGEAYFEVAKARHYNNDPISFFVQNKDQRIEVLGTHFNVYSYSGEVVKTTLLEGSVKVYSTKFGSSQLLKPGEQSQIVNGDIKVEKADLESSLAWKDGDFIFNNEELISIMKKLERWYGIEVEYTDSVIPSKFSGEVSRAKNLSEVLKIMEFTGKVKFKIDGRRVIVMM